MILLLALFTGSRLLAAIQFENFMLLADKGLRMIAVSCCPLAMEIPSEPSSSEVLPST